MKFLKILLLYIIVSLFNFSLFSQNSYIQVQGEANLKVSLNGIFKGTTKEDIGGYIIENVSSGKNKIKIEKEGFAPYEEDITVKSGEVLLYKVKPFVKHSVVISESGNTETTEKQNELKTGKLIIQSVPIEIKISIPSIEGVDNISKKKDIWTVESVPVGSYRVILSFNGKDLETTITVYENETTKIFGNLLSKEINVTSTKQEKDEKANKLDQYYKDIAPKIDAFEYNDFIQIGKTIDDLDKNKYKVKLNEYSTPKYSDSHIKFKGVEIGYCDVNPAFNFISSYKINVSNTIFDNFIINMKNYLGVNKIYIIYDNSPRFEGQKYEKYTLNSIYSNYNISVIKEIWHGDDGIVRTYYYFTKYPNNKNEKIYGTLKEF